MQEENLYTPEEVAKKLKLSRFTIYEMIKRGDIPAHHIGRSLRITDSQLETYLIRSSRTFNSFSAEIIVIDGNQFACIKGNKGNIFFSVLTNLEGPVKVSIRPEDIIISRERLVSSARNVHEGIITEITEADGSGRLRIDIGIPLIAAITMRSVREMDLKVGDRVYAVFKTLSTIVV